jgi:UDP-N-acetylmuramoylalanine--D-glutamate ligase
VDERDGILFVNDSKCTTVTALKVALEAFDRPVRLLAGGKFKGGDLVSLRALVKERVHAVGLFGAGREYIEKAWQGVVPMNWSPALEEAVRILATGAQAGDVVLLAPAAASFDLYADYEERGNDFKRIVKELLS